MKHNIIPMPNNPIIAGSGVHTITKNMLVDFGSFNPDCTVVFGQRANITLQAGSEKATLLLTKNSSLAAEEYTLTITKQTITIEAAAERGVIWALTSLYFLIENGTVPCLQLSDDPKHVHRGLLLDCARHFFSVEEVKKIIEEISLVKMNVFHWHLSDDQGFRVQCDTFPQLYKLEEQDYYTKDQIRDIVAFAKLRGVEVIPEIDLPGHTSAIVAAMPHLTCNNTQVSIKKQGGLYKITLCPGKEETYDFVTKMLDEICELFDSSNFHIGGDECLTVEWETCDNCKRRMEENGITEVKGLQSYFTKRVVEHLRSKGKNPIVWNDFLGSPGAMQDIDVQFWIETTPESKFIPFFKGGGKTIFSTMESTYLDYPHAIIPLEKIYAYTPKIQGESCEDAPNTMGIECSVWTERISTPHHLGEMVFPRAYAFAEAGWTRNRDYKCFEERLIPLLATLTEKGINFTPPEGWNPVGEVRRKLIADFFKRFRDSMPEKSDFKLEKSSDSSEKPKEFGLIFILLTLFEIPDPLLPQYLADALDSSK